MITTLEQSGTDARTKPRARRFTVEEYDRMTESGIFDKAEKTELLKGEIVAMSPKGKKHAAATDRATRYFIRLLGDRVIVRNQNPIQLDDLSEPEPDIALVAPRDDEYVNRHPQPADVLLILEVADTSFDYDRHDKGEAYAVAGIAHYLVMNLRARAIEDYREPSREGYRSKRTLSADERFNLVAFPEVEIKVGDLLPPE